MAKLAILSLLALLGTVSCQSYYGTPGPTPSITDLSPPVTYPSPTTSRLPTTVSPSPMTSTPSQLGNYPPPSPTPLSSSPPPSPSPAASRLRVGYYKDSCPRAEEIVRNAVKDALYTNGTGIGAGLIRLFFHDCFIRGCDASVLLDETDPSNPPEKKGIPNLSLRGFDAIDAAKKALEKECPEIVSCADIVAFAGRDAAYLLSNYKVDFDMPAGRYDGLVSLASETLSNLPAPFLNLQQLKANFATKGLSTDDMVTLSGAHTIGQSHCSSFSGRLPPNSSDMDANLAASLVQKCNRSGDPTVPQDMKTPNVLDNQYYKNVLSRNVLFTSDAALRSTETGMSVLLNVIVPGLWESKFKAAMVKMGSIEVKTNTNGEIRKNCRVINKPY